MSRNLLLIDPKRNDLRARLGAGTLDFARLGLLNVVCGNPVRVVGGGGGDRRGISRRSIQISLLGGSGSRLLGVSAASLLREVWRNPNGVEEVENTGEEGKDEEVEEDAGKNLATVQNATAQI